MAGRWVDLRSNTNILLLLLLICRPKSMQLLYSWSTSDCSSPSVSAKRSTSSGNLRSYIIVPCTLTPLAALLHSVDSMTRSSSEMNARGDIGSARSGALYDTAIFCLSVRPSVKVVTWRDSNRVTLSLNVGEKCTTVDTHILYCMTTMWMCC